MSAVPPSVDHRLVSVVDVVVLRHEPIQVVDEVVVAGEQEHHQDDRHARHPEPEHVALDQRVEAQAEDVDQPAPDDVDGRDDEDPVLGRDPVAGVDQPLPVVLRPEQEEERRQHQGRAQIGGQGDEHRLREDDRREHEHRRDTAPEYPALEHVVAAGAGHDREEERIGDRLEGAEHATDHDREPDAGLRERRRGGDVRQRDQDDQVERQDVVDPGVELRELTHQAGGLARERTAGRFPRPSASVTGCWSCRSFHLENPSSGDFWTAPSRIRSRLARPVATITFKVWNDQVLAPRFFCPAVGEVAARRR